MVHQTCLMSLRTYLQALWRACPIHHVQCTLVLSPILIKPFPYLMPHIQYAPNSYDATIVPPTHLFQSIFESIFIFISNFSWVLMGLPNTSYHKCTSLLTTIKSSAVTAKGHRDCRCVLAAKGHRDCRCVLAPTSAHLKAYAFDCKGSQSLLTILIMLLVHASLYRTTKDHITTTNIKVISLYIKVISLLQISKNSIDTRN
jgi:hypothetical protein